MKKIFGTTLVLLLAFLAAACGGDDGGSESNDTTTTTAAAETTTTTTAVADTTTTTTTAGGTGTGTTGTTVPPGGSANADAAALNVLAFCETVEAIVGGARISVETVRTAYEHLIPTAEAIAEDPLIQGDPALAEQAAACLEEFESIDLG